MRVLEYLIDRDRRHATMIDRAVAQHTRRAFRRVSQNLCLGRKGSRRQRISRTKNDNRRTSKGSTDMSGTSVVSHDQIRSTEYRRHLVQVRLTSEHNWLMSHTTRYFFRNVRLILRSDKHHTPATLNQPIRQLCI